MFVYTPAVELCYFESVHLELLVCFRELLCLLVSLLDLDSCFALMLDVISSEKSILLNCVSIALLICASTVSLICELAF